MKHYLTVAMISAGLILGMASAPFAFAQGNRSSGGAQRGFGGKGKQTKPRDGTGRQQGDKQKGNKTGPRDGSGPVHTPPTAPPRN
jgi:hypothetical protein